MSTERRGYSLAYEPTHILTLIRSLSLASLLRINDTGIEV